MAKIELTSELAKQYGREAGANVVGVAAADDFILAPEGFRPTDVLNGCRSVIVLGIPFSRETLGMKPPEYTALRNAILTQMTEISNVVAKRIKSAGYQTKSISASGGKTIDGKMHGHISLKHAAALAGIGVITRNYLLTSPKYGNLLWFSAVLTDAVLIPDDKLQLNFCENCSKCVDICPVGALNDSNLFGYKACGKFFKIVNRKLEIQCFACRSVCPYRFGKDNERCF